MDCHPPDSTSSTHLLSRMKSRPSKAGDSMGANSTERLKPGRAWPVPNPSPTCPKLSPTPPSATLSHIFWYTKDHFQVFHNSREQTGMDHIDRRARVNKSHCRHSISIKENKHSICYQFKNPWLGSIVISHCWHLYSPSSFLDFLRSIVEIKRSWFRPCTTTVDSFRRTPVFVSLILHGRPRSSRSTSFFLFDPTQLFLFDPVLDVRPHRGDRESPSRSSSCMVISKISLILSVSPNRTSWLTSNGSKSSPGDKLCPGNQPQVCHPL